MEFYVILLAVAVAVARVPCVVSSIKASVEHNSLDNPFGALGQAFFIPKERLLTSQLTARGATIFKKIPAQCLVDTDIGVSRKDESFYSDTKSLYSSISTDTNVDLSLKGEFTMGATLRAVTNNIASSTHQISGNSLQLYSQKKDYSISQNCINNGKLDKNFVKDFIKLDPVIRSPHLSTSWQQYRVFYHKYGSHVINRVITGSSIYQYAFADKSENYSQRNFTVKACASLAGPTDAGELGISACSGITQEEINRVTSLRIIQKLVVRGGTPATRSKLVNAREPDTIEKFMNEGTTDPQPVLHYYIPLWDILQAKFIGTPYMAQARNLEEYYKGFLDYGCSYQRTDAGQVIQRFQYSYESTSSFPSYECRLAPSGCHRDSDCHYRAAFWCACGGQSCIRYRDTPLSSGVTKAEAYVYNPGSSSWGWQGCRLDGLACYCSAPGHTWEVTWRDDRQHVLRGVHANEAARKKRDEAKIRALEKRCKLSPEKRSIFGQ